MKVNVDLYKNGEFVREEIEISEESKFQIFLNGKKIAELFPSPRNLKELAIGFLVSEGFVAREGIEGCELDNGAALSNAISLADLNSFNN